MEKTPSVRQTVIVTGGNSGLGYECARTIAKSGQNWQIVIASRDATRTAQAVEQLKQQTGYSNIEARQLNLASLASVRAFATEIAASNLPPLRAIVCNAGLQEGNSLTYTEDGFETTFGVNHLGHFLLVNLMLKDLAAPARVVFVSSGTHDPETIDGRIGRATYQTAEALAYPKKFDFPHLTGFQRYTTSKLCNLLCAYEMARRLEKSGLSGITVNAYDPGGVPGTGLGRRFNPAVQSIFWAAHLLRPFGMEVRTVADSGAAMARLVLDPTLENVTAKYFRGRREAPSSKDSYDLQKGADLWETSLRFTRLSPTDSALAVPVAVL